jgi:hypothetical protein
MATFLQNDSFLRACLRQATDHTPPLAHATGNAWLSRIPDMLAGVSSPIVLYVS